MWEFNDVLSISVILQHHWTSNKRAILGPNASLELLGHLGEQLRFQANIPVFTKSRA